MEEILPIRGSLPKPHVRSIYDSAHYFKAFTRYSENFVNRCNETECETETDLEESRRKIPTDEEPIDEKSVCLSETTDEKDCVKVSVKLF